MHRRKIFCKFISFQFKPGANTKTTNRHGFPETCQLVSRINRIVVRRTNQYFLKRLQNNDKV